MGTKKVFNRAAVLFLLILIMCLNACGNLSGGEDSGKIPDEIHEIEAVVLNEGGGSLMFYILNDENSVLVTVNTKNAKLTASDRTEITRDDFKTGQLVTISFDGLIAESYPGQILRCYGINVTGEADEEKTTEALAKYLDVFTTETTVYYVDTTGTLASKTVEVTFGDVFSEWKKLNRVPEEVTLLKMSAEDNAREEIKGELVEFHAATVRNFYLDLSDEFLTFLTVTPDEQMVIASLAKTIIGENPPAADTGVFLSVSGRPLKTEKNDFSGRLN